MESYGDRSERYILAVLYIKLTVIKQCTEPKTVSLGLTWAWMHKKCSEDFSTLHRRKVVIINCRTFAEASLM